MSNSYSWRIVNLIIKDLPNTARVVAAVTFSLTAERSGASASVTGEAFVPYNDSGDFTPFESLSEQQVMTWVMASLSVEKLQALMGEVDAALELTLNPPLRVAGRLPWAAGDSYTQPETPVTMARPDIIAPAEIPPLDSSNLG